MIKGKKLPSLNPKLHRKIKREFNIENDIPYVEEEVEEELKEDNDKEEEEEEGEDEDKEEIGFEDNNDSDDEMSETENTIDSIQRRHSNPEIVNHLEVSVENRPNLLKSSPLGSHQTLGVSTSTPVKPFRPEPFTASSNKVR